MRFVPRLLGVALEILVPGNSGNWQRGQECKSGTRGGTGPHYYNFVWTLTEQQTSCRVFSRVDRTVTRISNVSLGYEIVAIDPHNMPAGTYHGRLRYAVGDGGDLDFGSDFTYNTNELVFDITLTVTQDIAVDLVSGPAAVKLLPPGGWQKWGIQPPPYLSADLMFYLSAAGPFKVYLSACDIPLGDGCGIRHAYYNKSVPLQIAVSLPGMRREGVEVNLLLLSNNRAAAPILTPEAGSVGRHLSYLHFNVNWPEAKDMRRYGGKFAGNVTLMFDADF